MFYCPSSTSFSTGTGAQFLTTPASCTSSLEPTWFDKADRWAYTIGMAGLMLGRPVALCPPDPARAELRAPVVEICRTEYRASRGPHDYRDPVLLQLTKPASVSSTATAIGTLSIAT